MWNSSAFSGGFGNNTSFGNKTNVGGGFLNPGEFGSPGGGAQEKKKSERMNNVVPVTIGHIQQSADTGEEHLKIGSMSTHMITVVGMVRSVDEQSTRVTYFVDDMTGPPIEVQMWLGENEDFGGENRSSIMENTYVRVTGVLRSIKGKQLINAFKIVSVTDMNELTMHILEVVHTSMAVAVLDKQNSDDFTVKGEIKSEVMDTTYNSGGGNQNTGSFGGLNKNQQIVFHAITSCNSAIGVNYDYLYSSIKSLSRQTIKDTVDFLSNEGHIYSTVDDEHFKSTDSGF